jgi:hypothetical protein
MSVVALAAVLALGGVSLATEASARGGHPGGGAMGGGHWSGAAHISGGPRMSIGGGHWSGGPRWSGGPHWGGGWGGFHHRHFFFRRGYGLGIYGPYFGPDYYPYDNGCWRWRHVLTRWGWRWRRINVCYVPY